LNSFPVSTPQAARLCKCTTWQLLHGVYAGHLTPPRVADRYLWSRADIERARRYLSNIKLGRPLKNKGVAS
jgi:hypothetical protein